MPPKMSREHLGLAGEYAVATELCRRQIYAQLTLGNRKRTDLLVDGDRGMLRIQVKAKRGAEWPGINGPTRADEVFVLVDFAEKGERDRPDFYVLDQRDWKRLVRDHKRRWPELHIAADGTVSWADGYAGLNLKVAHVQKLAEKWEQIVSRSL